MPKRRVLIAGLFHETHTYLDGVTSLADFSIKRGAELLECLGDSSPLGGVLQTAKQRFDWEMIPVIDYRAQPSATVADEVVESWWRDFETLARPALAGGVEAIYLVLHGAMVSQSVPDVEGMLLERIRALPGAASLPVFGVFDLHANFSPRMAQFADCLVGYRENPHTDARAAAQLAAGLLHWSLTSGERPRMQIHQPGIIWPPTGTGTAADPMLSLNALARKIEAEEPEVWAVSVVPGFAFADTPDTGLTLVSCGVGDQGTGLGMLADLAEELREVGMAKDPPVDEVLAQLMSTGALPEGLTVLVEPSDNIGGGAPGDGTGLLRAMLRHGLTESAVCLADAGAVQAVQGVAVGGKTTLSVGGKGSRLDEGPLSLEVSLRSVHEGSFELEDKNSHLASMCGDAFHMGPCAVVEHAGITILLTSTKTPPFDLGQWRSVGIEPTKLRAIGVKAAVAHRRAYDGIATRMLWVDTPGPCSSDVSRFERRWLRRD
jgi:microcystin degradation protein MlrC